MRVVLAAIAILIATGAAAQADDLSGRQHTRAFWLSDQAWPNPTDHPKLIRDPRFGGTYTDNLAARLGVVNGRAEFFDQSLDGSERGGPKLVGSVDHGAAKVVLRWRPDEE